MVMNLYLTEHPDFGHESLAVPDGFEDCSYRNDDCPSWYNRVLGLKLWIDYAEPSRREPGRLRFALQRYADELEFVDEILQSDDYAAVLAAIEEVRLGQG
jgi:hypothetical protein